MGFLQNLFKKPDLDAMAQEARAAIIKAEEKTLDSKKEKKRKDKNKVRKVTVREYDRKLKETCKRLYRDLLPLISDRYERAIENGMENFILEKRYFMGAKSMKLIGEMILEDQFGEYIQVEKSGMNVWIQSDPDKKGVRILYNEAAWINKTKKIKKFSGRIYHKEDFNTKTHRSTIHLKTLDGNKVKIEGWNIPVTESNIRYDFYCKEAGGKNAVVYYRLKKPRSNKDRLTFDHLTSCFFEDRDDIGQVICKFPKIWDKCKKEEYLFSTDMCMDRSGEYTVFKPRDYLQGEMIENEISSKMNYWEIINNDLFCDICCRMVFENVKKASDISVYDLIDRKDYGEYLEKFGEDFNRFDYLQTKILYLIDSLQEKSGHLWIDAKVILDYLKKNMNQESDIRVIKAVLNHLILDEKIINFESKIFLRDIYIDYETVRRRFYTGVDADTEIQGEPVGISEILDQYEREQKIELNDEQRNAVTGVLKNQTSIITGGPGTGKTFVVKAIHYALRKMNPTAEIMFSAPTGKAAANLSSVVRSEGFTLHSILKLNPKTGRYDAENFSVTPDVLIVDETSMCDIFLLSALAMKIGKNTKVVFVGDPNQLQSVERGDMFDDMIHSESIPVYRLQKTYRQGGNVTLLDNARAIMRGNPHEMKFDQDQCTFVECGHDQMMNHISDWYYELASKFTPFHVKVISPYTGKKTSFGTEVDPINKMLSRKLTKGRRRVTNQFRDGEIIMATKNTDKYKNGQTGRIYPTDEGDVRLRFNNKEVFVEKSQLTDFEHGYATTINRSQGDEYKGVIIILDETFIPDYFYQDRTKKHFFTRDKLYTAFTRGKEEVVLIGSRKVLNYVIKNEPMKRNTGIYE